MNLLLLLVLIIVIGGFVAITVNSNKKESPKKTCNKYTYNSLCLENCGDKYVDETKKTCYDTIPDDMFADGKNLVSSCDDKKYIDGKECVSNCITRPVNVVIDGKNCIQTCNKYLNYADNKFECNGTCDYYSIDNKFKNFGIHDNICISPSNAITLMNMKNLFMSNDGNFIVDVVDGPEEKIFLKSSNYKTLVPLTLGNIGNNSFKKLLVSPSGLTYGNVYNNSIDVYTIDIFNTDKYYKIKPPISLYISSMVGTNVEIEDCIMYNDFSYLLLLKRSLTDGTVYSFYHVYIDDKGPVPNLIKTYEIPINSKFNFYHAVYTENSDNDYKICYTITDSNTIKSQVISYNITSNNNNIIYISNLQDTTIEQLNVNDYDLLDITIIHFTGVIIYYLIDKRQSISKPILRSTSYFYQTNSTEKEIDSIITSSPYFTTSRNSAYYSVYDTSSKLVSIKAVGVLNLNVGTGSEEIEIITYTIKTFGPYQTNPEVVLASNMNNTSMLCSITEINAENIPTRKELHKIDLTASPISSELLISS